MLKFFTVYTIIAGGCFCTQLPKNHFCVMIQILSNTHGMREGSLALELHLKNLTNNKDFIAKQLQK